jgi:CMP-N-acetylneuraminic acid synthetase
MKTVAFIFARGGSKGLPKKNTRIFAGKPLIAWAIERALEVPRIDQVIVSTDSEEIATISKQFGAEVPFIRPVELAMDDSSEWLSWRHALKFLQESTGTMPEIMVSVPSVAPLGLAIDISNCLDEYEKGLSDVVITVTAAHRNPYFNMVKKNFDGTYSLVSVAETDITRRQDAPEVFDMTTVCYVASTEFVLAQDSIFDGRVGAVHVPIERAIDIDSLLDFRIAEYPMSERNTH